MSVNGSFVSLNYAAEESFVDYLIASCDPKQTTAKYYSGVGNVMDLEAPAVIVSSDNGVETVHLSNVYDLTLQIAVKEMAADTNKLGSLTANIYNAVCDPNIKTKINLNNKRNFVTSFVQKLDSKHSVSEDTLVSDITLRVIGSLSGSL